MDMNTCPRLLHRNHVDPGQLRAHEDSGKSPYVLYMRKDTQRWQMKSSPTAHNAMTQDSLALFRRTSQLHCFTERSPANPFTPMLMLVFSPSNLQQLSNTDSPVLCIRKASVLTFKANGSVYI